MKIKFYADDKLPQNEAIKILVLVIVIRAVFHESNKHYPQVF